MPKRDGRLTPPDSLPNGMGSLGTGSLQPIAMACAVAMGWNEPVPNARAILRPTYGELEDSG